MELRKLAWVVATSALMPALAYADEYDDSIRASFARDINREPVPTYYVPAIAEAGPLDIVNAILCSGKSSALTQTLLGSADQEKDKRGVERRCASCS